MLRGRIKSLRILRRGALTWILRSCAGVAFSDLRRPDSVLLIVGRGSVRHGRLEERLVVSSRLDELFVQLCEIVCAMSAAVPLRGAVLHIPFFCEYFSMSLISFGRMASVWW